MTYVGTATPKENWQKIVEEMSREMENSKQHKMPQRPLSMPCRANYIDPPPLFSEMAETNLCENKQHFPSERPKNVVESLTRATFPVVNHYFSPVGGNACNKSILPKSVDVKTKSDVTNYDHNFKERQSFKNPNCGTQFSSDSLDASSINSPLPPKLVLNLNHGHKTTHKSCTRKNNNDFRRNINTGNCVSSIELRQLENQSNRTPSGIPENSAFFRPVSASYGPPKVQHLRDKSTPSQADTFYEYSETGNTLLDSETPSLFLDEDFIRKMHKRRRKRRARRKKRKTNIYGRTAAFRHVQLYQINGKRTRRRTNNKGITKRSKADPNEISANFLLALLTMLCCCPLGVMSMFYVCKVKKNLAKNDREGARVNSLAGRKLGNTGIKIGITGLAMALILLVIKSNLPYGNSAYEYDYYLPEYESG